MSPTNSPICVPTAQGWTVQTNPRLGPKTGFESRINKGKGESGDRGIWSVSYVVESVMFALTGESVGFRAERGIVGDAEDIWGTTTIPIPITSDKEIVFPSEARKPCVANECRHKSSDDQIHDGDQSQN